MEIVYQQTDNGILDSRLHLESPDHVRVNDRFARNGEHISHIEEREDDYILHTRFGFTVAPKSDSLYIWRLSVV